MITKTILTLALVMCLAMNPQVWAGGCGVHNRICVQPTVSHVVTPVKKIVVVEQHKVEFDADYFLGTKGYYDVVNELRQKETLEDRGIIAKQQEQQDDYIERNRIIT